MKCIQKKVYKHKIKRWHCDSSKFGQCHFLVKAKNYKNNLQRSLLEWQGNVKFLFMFVCFINREMPV